MSGVDPREGAPSGQLCDLDADPEETTNLYAREPAVVRSLTEELARLMEAGG